ncbi:MAG TPA: hypothetical protein P5181_14320 [Dermatophilaceae bacterium]|nr:hypothetical protein [Dermatophilaceae bacterium]
MTGPVAPTAVPPTPGSPDPRRPGRLARTIGYAATLATLVGALAVVPGDSCGATTTGACVIQEATFLQTPAGLGERVVVARGELTVLRATVSRTLTVGRSTYDDPDRIYLALRVRAVPYQVKRVCTAQLQVAGREYRTAHGFSGPPGIPVEGVLVLELPKELAGEQATVVVMLDADLEQGARLDLGPIAPVAANREAE